MCNREIIIVDAEGSVLEATRFILKFHADAAIIMKAKQYPQTGWLCD